MVDTWNEISPQYQDRIISSIQGALWKRCQLADDPEVQNIRQEGYRMTAADEAIFSALPDTPINLPVSLIRRDPSDLTRHRTDKVSRR
jgi:hypothetical protein